MGTQGDQSVARRRGRTRRRPPGDGERIHRTGRWLAPHELDAWCAFLPHTLRIGTTALRAETAVLAWRDGVANQWERLAATRAPAVNHRRGSRLQTHRPCACAARTLSVSRVAVRLPLLCASSVAYCLSNVAMRRGSIWLLAISLLSASAPHCVAAGSYHRHASAAMKMLPVRAISSESCHDNRGVAPLRLRPRQVAQTPPDSSATSTRYIGYRASTSSTTAWPGLTSSESFSLPAASRSSLAALAGSAPPISRANRRTRRIIPAALSPNRKACVPPAPLDDRDVPARSQAVKTTALSGGARRVGQRTTEQRIRR